MTRPVLIITFNRPELFRDLLQKVMRYQSGQIYIALDGPRANNEADAKARAEILKVIKSYETRIPLQVLIQERNLGCKLGVSTAISWFFSQEDSGIILEDDCEPNEDFFEFCSTMLREFAANREILSIGGYRASIFPSFRGSATFSRYPQVWGWATWKDRWNLYDVNLSGAETQELARILAQDLGINRWAAQYWTRRFQSVRAGKIDTWDYQLTYQSLMGKHLNVLPPKNLIRNRGFDQRSMHTGPEVKWRTNRSTGRLSRITFSHVIRRSPVYDFWLELFSYRIPGSLLLSWARKVLRK